MRPCSAPDRCGLDLLPTRRSTLSVVQVDVSLRPVARPGARGSADALRQRDDDALRAPDVRHLPRALVLADATDQRKAVRSSAIDGRLKILDLEGDVAQTQLVGGRGRRTGQVVGPDEAR